MGGDFDRASTHMPGAVTDGDCVVCHYMGDHQTGTMHFWDPDDARSVIATVTGDPSTDSAQAVKIHKDTKRELTVGGDIVANINFSLTHAAFGAPEQILATCNVVPATTPVEHQLELLAMLVDPAARGWGLWMSVDRTRLGAPADHGIMLHADEGVNIGIGQQSLLPEAGGVTVIEGGDGSYSYSGGALQIQDVRGQELEHVTRACPNLDIVVAVVSR